MSIYGEVKYIFLLTHYDKLTEILNAIHKDVPADLIKSERVSNDSGFIRLEIRVFMNPLTAGEFALRMFPGLKEVITHKSKKKKNNKG